MSASPPLRDALVEPFHERDVARLWPSVERRRARARLGSMALSVTTTALAAACAAALVTRPSPPVAPHAGPLRLDTGARVASLEAPASERVVRFDDRSRVTLARGARVTPRRNDGEAFETHLGDGRARFDVTPRGPRRWSVDCGLATVTVLGTSFEVERSPGALRVTVLHGLVRVDGARVPDGARVLSDGESIVVREAPVVAPTPAAAPLPATAASPPAPSTSPSSPSTPRAAPRPPAWRALAARRDFDGAWAALGPAGAAPVARTATADELLALGEVAHRSRHYPEAAELYGRFVDAHPRTAHAAMVAFTRGRIQLEQLRDPAAAARSFSDALRLGVPRHLDEDVRARRVEALARAGDREAARQAAADYLGRFPDGRRAADVRRWSP